MVELNFEKFPPQRAFKIDMKAVPRHSNLGQRQDQPAPELSRPIGTNDIHIAYSVGDAGDLVPWHTHAPALYQEYIPLEGRIRMGYKDNDGEKHFAEAGPGEMLYLPNGAHNMFEFLEDGTRLLVLECKETWIGRLDHMVGITGEDASEDTMYELNNPSWGLWYDNLRDVVHEKVDDAVEEW